MNKFILFLLLLTTFSYSTDMKACIVLPNDDVTINGPTTVCASNPTGSYNVTYSTATQDQYIFQVIIALGEETNVVPYGISSPTPLTCTPQLISQTTEIDECREVYTYRVEPACLGGVRFDVFWGNETPCDGGTFTVKRIQAYLYQLTDPFPVDDWEQQFITVDMNCLTSGGDTREDTNEPISIETNLEQDLVVDIFPNPAAMGSNVTVSLPENYDNYEVKILDLSGRLVQSHKNVSGQLAVNTSTMVESVYLIQVITPNGLVETKKLVLSK